MSNQDKLTIFFTASYQGRSKYQFYYDLVRAAIEKFQVNLISPEIGNYKDLVPSEEQKEIGNERLIHYEAIKRGIYTADAVIIEISNEDFQLGHEATLAMAAKKPVLCLSVHEDFSQKIQNDFFFGAKYTPDSVYASLQDFLVQVRNLHLSKRFNLFLYPQQLAYLEVAAQGKDVNVSEYVRQLINKDRLFSRRSG